MTHNILILDIDPPKRKDEFKNYAKTHIIPPLTKYFHSLGATTTLLKAEETTQQELLNELHRADSILLPGGEDVTPIFYKGSEKYKGSGNHTLQGDKHQITAVHHALKHEKRIFGICRGLQVINVALGGTLLQHFEGHSNSKQVKGDYPNRFAKTELKTEHPELSTIGSVNCSHHQGVDKLGEGLEATSHAPDGIVESVEHDSGLITAYQFHPEATADFSRHMPSVANFLLK